MADKVAENPPIMHCLAEKVSTESMLYGMQYGMCRVKVL
jgi:hypothetical protein